MQAAGASHYLNKLLPDGSTLAKEESRERVSHRLVEVVWEVTFPLEEVLEMKSGR